MRLQTKVLVISLPLSAALAALAAVTANRATQTIMVRELGRRLAPQVADHATRLAAPLLLGLEKDLLAPLQSAQTFSGAFFAESLDPRGVVMAHTNVLEKGRRRDDEATGRALAAAEVYFERDVTRGEPTLLISAPVWEQEEEFLLSGGPRARLGTLRLGLPLKPTLDSARRLGLIVAAMSAGFCLFCLSLFLVLVRLILAPVLAISEATARVAAGDYTVTVPVPAHDELARLAESFNLMNETLSRTVVSRDQLEHALSLAQAAMDASADGILVVGEGLKAISTNDRFLRMWGIPEELAAAGDIRRMVEFVLPQVEDRDSFSVLTTQHSLDFEAEDRRDIIRLKDGRVFERISLPFRVAGRAEGRTITTRDLTLHHEVLAALSRARDEALEAATIKTQFLTSVSHELRTPLNAVVGAAELLNGTKLDQVQREYSETVSRAAHTLLELIEGILDFSKIQAGRMTVEHRGLRVGAILEDAASMIAAKAAGKGLSLRIDAGEAASWDLMGDPTRLRQVLTNLLANAVKFTEKGAISAEVRLLSSEGAAAELEFSVLDTGIGITPEQGPRLFLPFSQADGTMSRRYGGTGLGLAICKSLVELMGGSIGFESDPGGGARFWFRIKLERAAPASDGPSSAAEPWLPTCVVRSGPRDRVRVLVVDDDETNRRMIVRQMEWLGCAAVAVGDGDGAMARMRSDDFGLVLMDCQMPGRDGLETTREIRRLEAGRRRTPVIAVSGNALEEDRRLCLEAGMDDFVAKPTTLERLALVVDRWDRPFDETALAAFGEVAADSPETLARLLDDFLFDARARLDAAQRAREAGDLAACAAAAHAIKGAAAAVGARGLRELARRIESSAKAEEPLESLGSLLVQAADEVSRLAESRPKK